ncbi:MAG: ABC transporter ATP-binding protein [Pseudomonadota bacterium]
MTATAPRRDPAAAPLRLEAVERRYGALTILKPTDLVLHAGETVALIGPSGSGKSSLLHIAGLLEEPSAGEVYIGGRAASGLNDGERTRLRRDALGFVYQFHHLLPEFTALGNVALPLRIAGRGAAEAQERAAGILEGLGLGERLEHQPSALSGGERQRAAIARALANEPQILLADEPTGNLDPETSGSVFAALIEAVRGRGLCALVATHDLELAAKMDRALEIRDQGLRPIDL